MMVRILPRAARLVLPRGVQTAVLIMTRRASPGITLRRLVPHGARDGGRANAMVPSRWSQQEKTKYLVNATIVWKNP